MMRRIAPGLLFCAVLACGGCAALSQAPSGPHDAQAPARSTLAAMQARYVDGRSEDFLSYFNDRDFANFNNFQQRVREFLLHNHQITMDIIVDEVLPEGGEVSVQAHWNRSFVDDSGRHQLQEGRCEFLFQERPSGGLWVFLMRGDSPF